MGTGEQEREAMAPILYKQGHGMILGLPWNWHKDTEGMLNETARLQLPVIMSSACLQRGTKVGTQESSGERDKN